MIRKLYILALLIPFSLLGQYDFETRYITINATSLPETEELGALYYNFSDTGFRKKTTFKELLGITADNYWQAVDMMSALEQKESGPVQPSINLPVFSQKEYGFSVSVNGSNSFNGTRSNGSVRNTVYREMRPAVYCGRTGVNLLAPN